MNGRRLAAGWVSLVALALVCLLFAGARFDGMADYPLDGDEIYSFTQARADWEWFEYEMVRDAIHPPLFYLLLRGWVALGGQSLVWVRLLPVLASVLCLIPLLLLCRELKLDGGETAAA
ncbi:MAG: hypothetical protein GY953_31995, partial [bacterium]|nr:hypothetical protein [bacterium]